MLKAVVIENFVHFEERTRFALENGANFIIGPNASGKSSFFELIRRCMSTKINHSWSSVFDPTKHACSVCEFTLETLPYQPPTKFQGDIKNEETQKTLISGFLYSHIDKSFIKICQIVKSDDYCPLATFVDYYRNGPGDTQGPTPYSAYRQRAATYVPKPMQIQLNAILKRMLRKNAPAEIQEIVALIMELDFQEKKSTTCEEILYYVTDNYFVATFGYHGLNPIRWTKSPLLLSGERDKIYKTRTESVEILNKLLSADTGKENSKIDSDLEKSIFKILTYPSNFNFQKQAEGSIIIDDGTYKMHIQKVPIGILEAKQVSLLLAHTHFKTLCLEEPDRAMHPQMVERLRDLILTSPELQDKVIVVQSHNQAMMSRWNLDRTHIFRRLGKSKVCAYRLGKIPNFSREDFLQIPFASKVLVTEGDSDKTFIKRIIHHLLRDKQLLKNVLCGLISGTDQIDKFKTFICNLHVIELGGAGEHVKIEAFIRKIGMVSDTFYIYDRDNFYTSQQRLKPINKKKQDERNEQLHKLTCNFKELQQSNVLTLRKLTIRDFQLSPLVKPDYDIQGNEDEQTLEEKLESRNTFIWRKGNLEEMVRDELITAPERFAKEYGEHATKEDARGDEPQAEEEKTVDPDELGPERLTTGKKEHTTEEDTRDEAPQAKKKKTADPVDHLAAKCFTVKKIKEKADSKLNEIHTNDLNFLTRFVLGGDSGKRLMEFLFRKYLPPKVTCIYKRH